MTQSPLNERRAVFVYEGARLAAIAAQAPIVPVPWTEREQPFRERFPEVIERQCSPQRSTSPHPDLVPSAQLGQLKRDEV